MSTLQQECSEFSLKFYVTASLLVSYVITSSTLSSSVFNSCKVSIHFTHEINPHHFCNDRGGAIAEQIREPTVRAGCRYCSDAAP